VYLDFKWNERTRRTFGGRQKHLPVSIRQADCLVSPAKIHCHKHGLPHSLPQVSQRAGGSFQRDEVAAAQGVNFLAQSKQLPG
jgi:hypothetical protein